MYKSIFPELGSSPNLVLEKIINELNSTHQLRKNILKKLRRGVPQNCRGNLYGYPNDKEGARLAPTDIQDDITLLLEKNKNILNLDKEYFHLLLSNFISSKKSVEYLYNLIFGKENSLYSNLLKEQEIADLQREKQIEILKSNIIIYKKFLKDFTVLYSENAHLKVLGYGEISTVCMLEKGRGWDESISKNEWVYKKLPSFNSYHKMDKYKKVFFEYLSILKEAGLNLPEQDLKILKDKNKKYIAYVKQKKLDSSKIGSNLIHNVSDEECLSLIEKVLTELIKIHKYNEEHNNLKLGIDGQISNWGYIDGVLFYLDTTSPLYRVNNIEQLDVEIFLKNQPFFLSEITRIFFLKQVLDRYYNLRQIIIDLIANFFKEGRGEIIPQMINFSNAYLKKFIDEKKFKPLNFEEIKKYYKLDSFIWKVYQFSRKVDKFFVNKVFGQKYEIKLPGKIKR